MLQRPGVQRIFVHDYEAPNVPSLRPDIDAFASLYAERALLMAQGGDVVVVADEVDPAFLEYLRELEIGPSPIEFWPLEVRPGRHAKAARPSC